MHFYTFAAEETSRDASDRPATPASIERRIVKVLTLLLFAYWKG
jgi:hypothetical protein